MISMFQLNFNLSRIKVEFSVKIAKVPQSTFEHGYIFLHLFARRITNIPDLNYKISTAPNYLYVSVSVFPFPEDPVSFTNELYSEHDRRRTFVNWPKPYISTDELARSGFFYYGNDKVNDIVKCAFCKVEVGYWDETDAPLSEHLKWSPRCPFLNGRAPQNIPIDEVQLSLNLPEVSPEELKAFEREHEQPQLLISDEFFKLLGYRKKKFYAWPNKICQPHELNPIQQTSRCEIIDPGIYSHNAYSERDRRRTFVNWTKSYIDIDDLARFGLFHLENDIAKCAFCSIELSDWDRTDTPLSEHLKYSPKCPFLNGRATQNIPIDEAQLNLNLQTVSREEFRHRPPKQTECHEHPDFALQTKRMNSFSTWPISIRQRPQELVDAGFFYSGYGDRVICFCCGLGWCDLETDDNPIVEHAKFTTTCIYLNGIMGQAYVTNIKRAHIRKCMKTKDVSQIEKVDNEISTERACKVCYGRVADILLQPCNHCATCGSCSASLDECPICRATIAKKMKIFF